MVSTRKAVALTGFVIVLAGAGGCSYDWTYDPTTKDGETGSDVESLPTQCTSTKPCPTGFACHYSEGCGTSPATTGKCVDVGTVCALASASPTCACNGELVVDSCSAAKQGVDVDESGAACSSSEYFPCAGVERGCKRNAEYCQIKSEVSNIGGCVPYSTCVGSTVDCSCADLPDSCSCDDVTAKAGGVTVMCK